MRSFDVPGVGRVTLATGEPCPLQWAAFDPASTPDLSADEAEQQAERYVDLAAADGVAAEAVVLEARATPASESTRRASARRSR